MPNVIEGHLQAKGLKFAIVVSRFNELICRKLLEGALDCIARHGGNLDDVDVAWVPGSFEIPMAAKKFADAEKYDAVMCLGAVIRGATPHADYISAEVTKGIAQVSLDAGVPVTYGVITPDTLEQAIERAGTKVNGIFWPAKFEVEISTLKRTDQNETYYAATKVYSLFRHELSHVVAGYVGGIKFDNDVHHEIFAKAKLGA